MQIKMMHLPRFRIEIVSFALANTHNGIKQWGGMKHTLNSFLNRKYWLLEYKTGCLSEDYGFYFEYGNNIINN